MIWISAANRKDLLDAIGGQRKLREVANVVENVKTWSPTMEELHLVWFGEEQANRALPPVILVERNCQSDFLAWASTFLPNYKPLTSHCRVMEPSTFREMASIGVKPWLGDFSAAALGLMFSEVIGAGESIHPHISFSTCRSTFSFAAARSMAIGLLPFSENILIEGWERLQKILHSPRTVLQFESLKFAWRILSEIESEFRSCDIKNNSLFDNSSIASACREIFKNGAIADDTWDKLSRSNSNLSEITKRMNGSREQRVIYFDEAIIQLRNFNRLEMNELAFMCGYLASRVAPGSLEHIRLITPLMEEFPGVQYWYGLCAGLQPNSEIFNYAEGVGIRLLRDVLLFEGIEDLPRSDISISELEILRSGDNQDEFWTSTPGLVIVEIAPMVSMFFRASSPRSSAIQPSLFPDERNDNTEMLRRLGDAIDEVQHFYQRLARPTMRSRYERNEKRWKK